MYENNFNKSLLRYRLISIFQFVLPIMVLVELITNFNPIHLCLSLLWAWVFGHVGMSIVYHRIFSHKIIQIKNSLVMHLACIFGVNSTCVGPVSWSVNHIQHHLFTDTEKDPHSPVNLGWKAAIYAYHNPPNPDDMTKREQVKMLSYVKHLLNDRVVMFYEKYYMLILLLTPTLLWTAFDYSTMIYIWAIPVCYSLYALLLSVMNHGGRLGGKMLDFTADKAHNNYRFGWLINPFDKRHADHHLNTVEDDFLNRILKRLV